MEDDRDVTFARRAVIRYPPIIRAGKKKTAKYLCGICGREIRRGATYCSACRLEMTSLRKRKYYKYMPVQRLEQVLKEKMLSQSEL